MDYNNSDSGDQIHSQPPGGRIITQFLIDDLQKSGLTPDDVPAWRALMGSQGIARALGQPDDEDQFAGAAIAIPYFDLDGNPIIDQGLPFIRAKMMDPAMAETGKYRSPINSAPHIYIPPKLRMMFPMTQDGRVPCSMLVITEGEKKAESLVKVGIAAVALAGVWMWAVPLSDAEKLRKAPKQPLAELLNLIAEINPNRILNIFDSDGALETQAFFKANRIPKFEKVTGKAARYAANPQVWLAGQALAETLMAVCRIPAATAFTPWLRASGYGKGEPKLAKAGIDDFICDAADQANMRGTLTRCPPAVSQWLHDQTEGLLDLITQDDIDRAVAARNRVETGTAGANSGGYIPLGISGDQSVVVWNRESQRIVTTPQSKITNAATLMSMCGGDFVLNNPAWQTSDSDDGKRGIDIIVAAAEIFTACAALGPFYRDKAVRGAGVWADPDDPDGLIINASNGVFRIRGTEQIEIPRCETGRLHVYPRSIVAPRVMHDDQMKEMFTKFDQDDPNRNIFALVTRWHYRREIDGMLLAGWWCSTAYLGALDARPGAFVTGESASGKTALFNRLSALMTSYKHHIELGSDSSQPGIRQLLGRDALPLILDELEPGNGATGAGRKRAETVEGLFRMLRASYSASGGDRHGVIKGSAGGEAVDFSIRTAGLVGGVNVAQLDQADRNRLLIIELTPPPEGAVLPEMLSDDEMEAQGHFVRMLMWRNYALFRKHLPEIVRKIRVSLGRTDGRVASTYGIPICAMAVYSIVSSSETDPVEIDKDMVANAGMLIEHVREHFMRTAGGHVTDQSSALEKLMSSTIEVQMTAIENGFVRTSSHHKTISDVVELAVQEYIMAGYKDERSADTRSPYLDTLKKTGMTVRVNPTTRERWLFYCSGGHTQRQKLENNIGMGALGRILERLEGALKSESAESKSAGLPAQMCIAGAKRRGIWIPLMREE